MDAWIAACDLDDLDGDPVEVDPAPTTGAVDVDATDGGRGA